MQRGESAVIRYRVAIILVAFIWAAVILACSLALEGTGLFARVSHILGGGAAVSIIVLGSLLRGSPSDQQH